MLIYVVHNKAEQCQIQMYRGVAYVAYLFLAYLFCSYLMGEDAKPQGLR
jgi:hypothetical protein